jgi:site-specific recombinase XerD
LDVTGKGGHKRNVPVLPELLLKTRDFIDEERRDLLSDSKPFKDCGLVFISQKTGGALSKEYVSRFFSAALNHGGKRKYWLHRLRARFASKLIQTLIMDSVVRSGLASLREETILFKAAEILGHKDLKSLRFYLNLSLDMLEPEIKAAMQQPKFFTKAGAQALKDQEDFG